MLTNSLFAILESGITKPVDFDTFKISEINACVRALIILHYAHQDALIKGDKKWESNTHSWINKIETTNIKN